MKAPHPKDAFSPTEEAGAPGGPCTRVNGE